MHLFSTVDPHDDNLMMTSDLIGLGYDDRDIRRLLARGQIHRVSHGAYAYGAHWAEASEADRRRLLARAALRRARRPVALAGPSAADAYDVPVWDLGDTVHLTRVDQKAGRRSAGSVQHRPALNVEDLTVRHGLPVTSGTRTALDMIALTDVRRALVVVNGLLHAGETTVAHLERRATRLRHDPNTLNTPIVLGLATPRCESAGESLALHLFWTQHLPKPQPQYEIRDRSGRVVARVDFAWPELGLFVEFDGRVKYEHHRREGESIGEAVLREKAREDLIRELTGWRCIRIVWADLFRPAETATRIREAMARQRGAA